MFRLVFICLAVFWSTLVFSQVTPERDAFGYLRVTEPRTIFDSKLLGNNRPVFWDDQETSGSGTTSTYSSNRASVTLAVDSATAGTRVRQTFQRFNYQPGKSQRINITTVIGSGRSGIVKRIGQYDANNGLFLEQSNDSLFFVIRSNVTGSPTDTRIYQGDWNIDEFADLKAENANILWMDYESLQVGSVRFGFVIDGKLRYAHIQRHANRINSAYFSTPNNPIRAEIINDGTADADSLEIICVTVISEGGQEVTGINRGVSTAGVHLDANAVDTLHALIAIRLDTGYIDNIVNVSGLSVIAETNDDFEWVLLLNPTVNGTALTYNDVSDSAIEYALGISDNKVTSGTFLDGGFSKQNAAINTVRNQLRYLGEAIDGTKDIIVLCVRPLSANADFQGTINWSESP